MKIEHYTFHIEWWPTDEPVASFTVHMQDGTYRVVPALPLGPFDNLTDVLRQSAQQLDMQLSLW